MVHVEIEDGDAVQPVDVQGVRGGARDVVVEAEPHGAVALGVMSRRPHTAEGIVGLAAEHQVDRPNRGAGRPFRRFEGEGIHGRVRIDEGVAFARCQRGDLIQIGGAVYP